MHLGKILTVRVPKVAHCGVQPTIRNSCAYALLPELIERDRQQLRQLTAFVTLAGR